MDDLGVDGIEDSGMWLDSAGVDATLRAGLASQPPHLADPKLHVASKIGVWGLHYGLLQGESAGVTKAIESVAHDKDWILLETPPMGKWTNALTEGRKVTAFSPDRKVLERFAPKSAGKNMRIVGEVRDAFRHLKLNAVQEGRVLVWPGLPFNRLSPQGFPYLLRYIGQVMNDEDCLVMGGVVGSTLKLQGFCRSEQVRRSARKLLGWALPEAAEGDFGWSANGRALTLTWKSETQGPVSLNTWWSLDGRTIEGTFEFAGLEHTYQCSMGGARAWVLRKRPR